MTITLKQLEAQVAEKCRDHGFNIVSTATTFPRFDAKPDIMVEQSQKYVAIELKARPAMLSDVSKASQYRQKGQVGTLLCPLLLLVLATIAPASARACGACLDASLLQWSWWTTGVYFATAVLFVELIVYGILSGVVKQPHRGRAR